MTCNTSWVSAVQNNYLWQLLREVSLLLVWHTFALKQHLLCSLAALFSAMFTGWCECRACVVSVPGLWQAAGLKLAQNRWSTSRGVLWSLTFLLNGLGMYCVTQCAEPHMCALCVIDKEIWRTAWSGSFSLKQTTPTLAVFHKLMSALSKHVVGYWALLQLDRMACLSWVCT